MRPPPSKAEVLVVGGGMAGLCAAISAQKAGATVRILEASPRHMRGGNLRHARNIRIPHDGISSYSPGIYPVEEFARELTEVSRGDGDAALIDMLASRAADLGEWLADQGVVFQTKHIPFSRRTAFFLGGGKAATNALYARIEALGIAVSYETPWDIDTLCELPSAAVVLCCGGDQADARQRFINRGTPFNVGAPMEGLIRAGAAVAGVSGAVHLVAVDARSPRHDGGIVTRIDGMQFGMMVDAQGRRFADETAIVGSRRYSIWGQTIAALPVPSATLVLDAGGMAAMPRLAFEPIRAANLGEMAALIEVDFAALSCSARQSGRVRKAPFFAYPVVSGLTFSCHGLRVDTRARVKMGDGSVSKNLFAAGAIMAPAVLHIGYLSGTALTISAVFGRIAGEEAARHALG
ncbi:FAD-dependent tricarballylate dehydrogenase TcuA [Neorhizobium sp. JUb45]|uniref:FAD-dependent tricarballylate dehydrogenase TcuA n=1 Tax=unclassified Neorhizobium TaxID=2629175 RepID=UPI00104D2072|nr:FAD-dependent tricarballylate dehydrogenase TcuA [Neorhizobium sp. JUb45]TCR03101.1 tricarballylate dehydrogenase [Neorhizobium sp. JUb45]